MCHPLGTQGREGLACGCCGWLLRWPSQSSQLHPPTSGLVARPASPTHVLTLTQQGGPGQPDLFCLLSEKANSGQTLVTPDSCSPLTKKETAVATVNCWGWGGQEAGDRPGHRKSESQPCTGGRGGHGSRGGWNRRQGVTVAALGQASRNRPGESPSPPPQPQNE